jgi:hypothetical protein
MSAVLYSDDFETGSLSAREYTTDTGSELYDEIFADSVSGGFLNPVASDGYAFLYFTPDTAGDWSSHNGYFEFTVDAVTTAENEYVELDLACRKISVNYAISINVQIYIGSQAKCSISLGPNTNYLNFSEDITTISNPYPASTAISFKIRTSDSGVFVYINDDLVGQAPVVGDIEDFKSPNDNFIELYCSGIKIDQAQALSYFPPTEIYASASSVLGSASVAVFHNYSDKLGDVVSQYVMDLITPSGNVRLPISSWQATLQTGASNYVQCVVPAIANFSDALNAATEFVIYRRAALPNSTEFVESEMARAPTQTIFTNRGPQRFTATVSGYSPAFTPDPDPSSVFNQNLQKVRSISSSTGGLRVRCAVNWQLKPGMRAIVDESTSLVVAYINYYVGRGDAYMDVGERV